MEKPTNAFGEIIFSNTTQVKSKVHTYTFEHIRVQVFLQYSYVFFYKIPGLFSIVIYFHCQYVRLGYPTDGTEEQKCSIVNTVCELLLSCWKMPRPNLVISVIGGSSFIKASSVQKKRFRRHFCSIIRIAMKTGATVLESRN